MAAAIAAAPFAVPHLARPVPASAAVGDPEFELPDIEDPLTRAAHLVSGDDELRARLERELSASSGAAPAFLASSNYHLTSRLAWLADDRVPTLPMELSHTGQYRHWNDGAALLGQDAVWVEHGSRRRLRAHMHALFESVEPLAPVTILLGGRPVTRYLLFRCRGFRGVPGLTPGVPEFDEH
jgi:hypothetical protein